MVEWGDIHKQVMFSHAGPNHELQKIVKPFMNEVYEGLEEEGFKSEDLRDFNIPGNLLPAPEFHTGPRGDFGASALVIGVSVFLGTTIGAWAVEKVCDEVYDVKIRPAFRNLLTNWGKSKNKQHPATTIRFSIWYDVDQIMVNVVAEGSSKEELKQASELIPEAHKAALSWLENHGIQKKVLTYRIRQGQLSKFPELSDTVPE